MTNVLPLERQRTIWKMHRARFLLVFSIILMMLAAVAALALIPSYLALQIASPLSAEIDTTNRPKTGSNDPAGIVRTQALVTQLLPLFSATTSPTIVIRSAIESRPRGITIDRISYARGEKGQLVLGGESATRDAVQTYRSLLTQNSYFKNVSVPVGSLVGSGTGRFSITLSGTF